MSNLWTLMQSTLLLSAKRDLQPQSEPKFTVREIEPGPNEIEPHKRRIWHYSFNPGELSKVTNLTVRHRIMKHMEMPVCDEISWGKVAVSYRGKVYDEVPLTKDYLLESYFLDGGASCEEGVIQEGASRYFPLAANLQSSYQLVFAYEMSRDRTNTMWQRPTDKALRDPSFIEPGSCSRTLPVTASTGPGYTAVTIQLAPLRLVVVLTLGLCTERDDFAPGNVLGSARMYPLISMISNAPLDWAEGTVTIKRAPRLSMVMMDGEEMMGPIAPILFADRNDGHAKPIPYWDNLFDYYETNPSERETFMAVRPGTSRRQDKYIAEYWGEIFGRYRIRPSLYKVAGQGEFDNLHLAPRMKAPNDVLDNVAGNPELRRTLSSIVMAPFCMHDCLHTHWRWAEFVEHKQALGWDGFTPYAKAGAPMVPPNQEVTIRLLPSGFEYTAKALKPVPGQWQIMYHHGSAYGISLKLGRGMAMLLRGSDFLYDIDSFNAGSPLRWSAFYWRLRYEATSLDKFFERVPHGGAEGGSDADVARQARLWLRKL